MTIQSRDVIVFVPGLLGFGAFGPKGRPLIEYFFHVLDTLERVTGVPGLARRCIVHEPPPTGPLSARVSSLAHTLDGLLREGLPELGAVARVHLVGHSTGGLDARLLVNQRYPSIGGPSASEQRALLERIGSVVTLSAPHGGAPFAKRISPYVDNLIGKDLLVAAYLASIVAASGRALPGGPLINGPVERLKLLLFGRVAESGPVVAEQVRRFIDHVRADVRLFDDLQPDAMRSLQEHLREGDTWPIHSFMTTAPKPSWWSTLRGGGAALLYAWAWGQAKPLGHDGAPFPRGEWLGDPDPSLEHPFANDGVVPTSHQAYASSATRQPLPMHVRADHVDVIGHFANIGETFFDSGAGMSVQRFEALWREIGARL